jgi:hypothetical protein
VKPDVIDKVLFMLLVAGYGGCTAFYVYQIFFA